MKHHRIEAGAALTTAAAVSVCLQRCCPFSTSSQHYHWCLSIHLGVFGHCLALARQELNKARSFLFILLAWLLLFQLWSGFVQNGNGRQSDFVLVASGGNVLITVLLLFISWVWIHTERQSRHQKRGNSTLEDKAANTGIANATICWK